MAQALLHGIEHPTTVPTPVLGDHTPAGLLHVLRAHASTLYLDGATWPRTPKMLSEHLRRIAPALLASRGVTVTARKTNGRRVLSVALDGDQA